MVELGQTHPVRRLTSSSLGPSARGQPSPTSVTPAANPCDLAHEWDPKPQQTPRKRGWGSGLRLQRALEAPSPPGSRSGTRVARTERGALAPHLCLSGKANGPARGNWDTPLALLSMGRMSLRACEAPEAISPDGRRLLLFALLACCYNIHGTRRDCRRS